MQGNAVTASGDQAIREVDLGRLHDLDDLAAEGYLASLSGVGPKTAACVLALLRRLGSEQVAEPPAAAVEP